MDFNAPFDRRNTRQTKWDGMQAFSGISPDDGLAMWIADSDYPTAPCVREALKKALDHGAFGYGWEDRQYLDAICWWMKTRHNWDIDPDWIISSQGLGHGIATCLDIWSNPGDGVVTFSPVYHEFASKVHKAGRALNECPLVRDGDTYVIDFDDAQSRMTGNEKVLIWCSPQNPSGRIWTAAELRAVADFAARNDLLLLCDEVHHDLIYPGETFVPMFNAAPQARARTIYLTAASKTFNLAGQRTGNMIIPDDRLRSEMRKRLAALDYAPNYLAILMITAAYSAEGAAWVDAQMAHLDANRKMFDAGVNAIPGVKSMPLQSTFLAWVDFADTGMTTDEFQARLKETAKIAASPGTSFGQGGATFMRFNLAMPGPMIADAVTRLQKAFADLQ